MKKCRKPHYLPCDKNLSKKEIRAVPTKQAQGHKRKMPNNIQVPNLIYL